MAEVLLWHAFPCKNISYQRGVRTCGRGTMLIRDPLPAAMVWVNGAEGNNAIRREIPFETPRPFLSTDDLLGRT